jgi:hypothetical protein
MKTFKHILIILALSFLVLFPEVLLSQDYINLGSGTSVNGTTSSSPVNIYYRRNVSQFVYTAAELSAAGVPTGASIEEIG